MDHGIVDIFAFQEALLIEAVFGIALLTMMWVGFRRWLQQKEKMGRLIAEQMAHRHGAQMESVEARLEAIEHMLANGSSPTATQIEGATPSDPSI